METAKIFQQSLLAEASYADFRLAENPDGSFDKAKVKTALTKQPTILGVSFGDPAFTQSQAQDFVDHWKVISHQPMRPVVFLPRCLKVKIIPVNLASPFGEPKQ